MTYSMKGAGGTDRDDPAELRRLLRQAEWQLEQQAREIDRLRRQLMEMKR